MDDIPTMPKSKAEHVAQQLLDRIITANLAPGSSFGTESDLLEQFSVSRPTLRESLRILESQGVLELRPGPGGGIMVKTPTTDILAHGLSVFLRLNDVPFIAVLQAREVIEPALAGEAALNGTDEDFDELEASIERMKTIADEKVFIEERAATRSWIPSGRQLVFWRRASIMACVIPLQIRSMSSPRTRPFSRPAGHAIPRRHQQKCMLMCPSSSIWSANGINTF